MPAADTPRQVARELRLVARAALKEYGVEEASLAFLAGGKQPAFRVRAVVAGLLTEPHPPDRGSPRSRSGQRTGERASHGTPTQPDDCYTANTFLLRLFPEGSRTQAAIRSEFRWLNGILADTSIVVPQPVLVAGGDSVVTVSLPGDERLYHCALTRWVKGRLFLRDTGPGPRALRLVGRAMAQLHRHGRTFKRDAAFSCPRWDEEGLFGTRSPYFPDAEKGVLPARERRLFAGVTRQCRDAMDRLGVGRDVFGLVHGDLIQLNYLFHKGDVRIIDFGDFGYSHHLYDMAITLFALLDLDKAGTQRRAFLEGYREVRGLAAEHEDMLDIFLAARGVLLSRFVIGTSGGRLTDGGKRYVDRVTNCIREWMNGG